MLSNRESKVKRHSIKTVIFGICGIIFLFWMLGLFTFLKLIPDSADKPPLKTDAIVVLTGGSLRLQTGLLLLKKGWAEKLFVSGVHRGVDVRQLLRLARTSPSEAECCIQLGHAADDTAGNAAETQQWMAAQNFQSLDENANGPDTTGGLDRAASTVKLATTACSAGGPPAAAA